MVLVQRYPPKNRILPPGVINPHFGNQWFKPTPNLEYKAPSAIFHWYVKAREVDLLPSNRRATLAAVAPRDHALVREAGN